MRITLLFYIICKSLIDALRQIIGYNKKTNVEREVVSPLQLHVHIYRNRYCNFSNKINMKSTSSRMTSSFKLAKNQTFFIMYISYIS